MNFACVEEDLAQEHALLFTQYVNVWTRVAYGDTATIRCFFVGSSPNFKIVHVCQTRLDFTKEVW